MPSLSLKSKQALHKQLSDQSRDKKASATVYIPARYARYSPDELFAQFKLANMTHYGDVAAAYGEYGGGVEVNVGLDFAMLLTGIPAMKFLSMTASVGGAFNYLKETMVVLHQVAPVKNTRATLKIGDQAVIPRQTYWKTRRPVALMVMSGAKQEYKGSLAFDFTAQVIPATPLEGYTLRPDVKVGSLNLTATITKHNFAWATDLPRWYPSYTDQNIKIDFQNILGLAAKVRVKEEIIEWLQHVRKLINQLQSPNFQQLKDALKDLPKRRFHRKAHFLPRPKNDPTEAFTEKIDTLLSLLDTVLATPLQAMDQQTFDAVQGLPQIKQQARWFRSSLHAARAEEANEKAEQTRLDNGGVPRLYHRNPMDWTSIPSALRDEYAKKCFAKLSIWNPSFSADIGLALKPEPKITDVVSTEAVTGTLSAGAGFAVKYATARYQTFALSQRSKRPLIMTQDSYLRYSQWWFNKSAVAKMDNLKFFYPATAKAGKPKVLIQKLQYSAVTYFREDQAQDNYRTFSRPGSGINYGTHISPSRLESLVHKIVLPGQEDKAWKQAKYYATLLELDRKAFETFAKAVRTKIAANRNNWDNIKANYSEILVESAYRFDDHPLQVVKGELPDLLQQFDSLIKGSASLQNTTHAAGPFTLESVRIRVRSQDHRNGPHTSFKLGLIGGPVTATINFKKITRSGNEGTWEYFYYPAEANPPLTLIPPVFLLPHTFQ